MKGKNGEGSEGAWVNDRDGRKGLVLSPMIGQGDVEHRDGAG